MIRRLWLHNVPEDLFGYWSGKLVLDVDGIAPTVALFRGDIEGGFERTAYRSATPVGARPWVRCGPALERELATLICRIRLSSWEEHS